MQVTSSNTAWEVIVVNNASTDDTAATSKTEWAKYNVPINFKLIEQPITGKTQALLKGVTKAKFDYILTCDDDNWLNENYIENAFKIMRSDPNIGVLGGCGIFEPEQPFNIDIDNYKAKYVNGPQMQADTEHWLYGAGSVYKKAVFNDIVDNRWNLITSGRIGNKLNGGEDVEFCFVAYLKGYKIIADDNLQFKHFVPLQRQNIKYLLNLYYWLSYSNVLLNSYFNILHNEVKPIEQVLNGWLLASGRSYLKQSITMLFKKQSLDEKLAYKAISGTFFSLLYNRKKIIAHNKHLRLLIKRDANG